MRPAHSESGPWQLVGLLRDWADATAWCEWVELAGSLGRGGGDERSDVDAGLGVADDVAFDVARDEALAAVSGFAPVADSLVQSLAASTAHLVVQYDDGRQLSLVVMRGSERPGLPPGARSVFDRTGQLDRPWRPDAFHASAGQQREWAFLGWLALLDAVKHSARHSYWRALTSLDEARVAAWRLHAAALGVDYPLFGAVSVENAGAPPPAGLADTLPDAPEHGPIVGAARALALVLAPLTEDLDVDGIARLARARLASG